MQPSKARAANQPHWGARNASLFGFGLLLACGYVAASGQTAEVKFEVASVKADGQFDISLLASGKMPGLKVDRARVEISSYRMIDLIAMAFRVNNRQVTGPAWAKGDCFTINAKFSDGANSAQMPEMLAALLAERFDLKFHREKVEQAVYALVIGKDGPKLRESSVGHAPDSHSPDDAASPAEPARVTRSGDLKSGGSRQVVASDGTTVSMSLQGTRMEYPAMRLSRLAEILSQYLDRQVVDLTGLEGTYDVAIELSIGDLRNSLATAGMALPPEAAAALANLDEGSGGISASLKKLGLRLEPRRAPMERIVVDQLLRTPKPD